MIIFLRLYNIHMGEGDRTTEFEHYNAGVDRENYAEPPSRRHPNDFEPGELEAEEKRRRREQGILTPEERREEKKLKNMIEEVQRDIIISIVLESNKFGWLESAPEWAKKRFVAIYQAPLDRKTREEIMERLRKDIEGG